MTETKHQQQQQPTNNELKLRLSKFDYAIFLDTEFIGPNVVNNQITSIGIVPYDLKNNCCLEPGVSIGHFHLNPEKSWEKGCREWWDKNPKLKLIAESIDQKVNTRPLREGIEEFVKVVKNYKSKYGPNKSWVFVVDTNSIDVSHLNYSLALYGHEPLTHLLSDYTDVFSLRELYAYASALGLSGDDVKKREDYPKNLNPHDALADVQHNVNVYRFYRGLFLQ